MVEYHRLCSELENLIFGKILSQKKYIKNMSEKIFKMKNIFLSQKIKKFMSLRKIFKSKKII